MTVSVSIQLDRLDLDRSGRPVLREVTWTVRPGEKWLVLGPNGAGKTQLLKVLAGDVWPNPERASRRYRVRGEWHDQPHAAREEIAWLGPERQDRYERYAWNFRVLDVVGTGLSRTDIPASRLTPTQRRTCLSLLRRAGIARLAARRFLTLSYGERRLVLLARAWAWQPAVMLLDEAASGLDEVHRRGLQRFLAMGRSRHLAWVCTAHRVEDAPTNATHLLLLDKGRVTWSGPMPRPRKPRASASAVTLPVARPAFPRRPGPVLVRMQDANVYLDGKCVLGDIRMQIRRGECWVVHGANGSGKSTLLRTIYGDHGVASGGLIERAGISPGIPLEEFRARTALVSPQLQADYPPYASVLETVVSGLHSSIGLNEAASAAEQRRARTALRQHGLLELADRTLGEISCGQKRRVLFARASITNARLWLLDEPFAGLDSGQRALLLRNVEQLSRAGKTIVLATHYRTEWPRGATHELHLSGGKVAYAGRIRR
jgi:molybdate transport system ATP-binding protein